MSGDITIEPDAFLGFVARPVTLRTGGYVIVTGCHARTAADAEETLRRMLAAGEKGKMGQEELALTAAKNR